MRFLFFTMVCSSAYAASPSFSSFNSNQFGTNGNVISVKNGAAETNVNFVGATVRNPSYTNQILLGTSDNVNPSINTYGNNGMEFHADLNNGGITWWIGNQVSMSLLRTSADPIPIVSETFNKTLGTSDRGAGSTVSMFVPRLGGSGSAIQDLPLHGADIWQNQPKPVFGMRIGGGTTSGLSIWSASQTNLENVITNFQAAHIPNVMTNAGVSIVVVTDTGWLAPHRTNGLLTPNPAFFPNITNSVSYAHAAGFEFWVNAYFNQGVPTLGNTEIDCNVAGSASSIFQFPLGANPNGTNYIHPVITPNTARGDVNMFYDWQVDGLAVQDTNPWNAIAGYEFQRSRLIGNAVVYPGSGYFWSALYETSFNHGLSLVLFANTPHVPALAYECNSIILDNFITGIPAHDGQPPLNSSPVSLAVAYSRAFYRLLHYGPENSVRPTYLVSFNVLSCDNWGDHGYKSFLGMAAVMRGNILFQQPLSDYTTMATVCTNAGFLSLWPAVTKNPTLSVDNGNNSVWSTQVDTDVVACFANEITSASTNITVTWTQLGIPTGTVCNVYDTWTNSLIGSFTNSYTGTVAATNILLRRFVRQ